MTYWIEVRSSVRRSGAPKLVPLADAHKYRGFRSVYAYPDDVADLIRAQGSTRDLRGVPVYADTIFVDFDGRESEYFDAWLREQGYAFTRWDSGNRSDHYHVALAPCEGPWVPAAMRSWLQRHAPTSDVSYCHPGGQYRLPMTWHAKAAGRRKELVSTHEGQPVTLKQVNSTVSLHARFAADEGDAYHKFFSMITQSVQEGGRRPFIWRTALLGAEAGLTEAEVLDHLCWWASHFCIPPHEPRVVAEQVSGAFKYLLRKVGNGE